MAPKKEVALSKTGWTTLVHLVLAAWKPQERIGPGVTTSLLLPGRHRLLLSQNSKLCPQYMSH